MKPEIKKHDIIVAIENSPIGSYYIGNIARVLEVIDYNGECLLQINMFGNEKIVRAENWQLSK